MDPARSVVPVSRARGWYWPWLLASGMLGVVLINVVMLAVAASDANGAVVEADYYRKAVAWDRTLAARAASAALGWQPAVTLTRLDGPSGAVTVQLRDRAGRPLPGVRVEVTLIHNLAAAHPVHTRFQTASSGVGRQAVPLRWPGRWEARLIATRGPDRFEWEGRVELEDASGAAPSPAR